MGLCCFVIGRRCSPIFASDPFAPPPQSDPFFSSLAVAPLLFGWPCHFGSQLAPLPKPWASPAPIKANPLSNVQGIRRDPMQRVFLPPDCLHACHRRVLLPS